MAKVSFQAHLKNLFGIHPHIDEAFFEELTDTLVEGDIGARTACEIVDELERRCKTDRISEKDRILDELQVILTPMVKTVFFDPPQDKVSVYMLLGVNGVGKTTSCAKMAVWYQQKIKQPIILAAADTFRAAAIEQLQFHGEKIGIKVVAHQHGADPGAVVYDAAESVRSRGGGLVIADTAGRLHNRENLVRELQKIDRIAQTKADPDCYRKFLILDATTGQNGLRQAEVFHDSIGLDAIILTKYDSTAKGGIAISVGKELGLPVAFVGTGERYSDFAIFDRDVWLSEFIGKTEK